MSIILASGRIATERCGGAQRVSKVSDMDGYGTNCKQEIATYADGEVQRKCNGAKVNCCEWQPWP